jgi:hypothetical protein
MILVVPRRDSVRDSRHRRRRLERLSTVNRSSRIRGRLWSRKRRTSKALKICSQIWMGKEEPCCGVGKRWTSEDIRKARAWIVENSGSAIHFQPRTLDSMSSRRRSEHPSPYDPGWYRSTRWLVRRRPFPLHDKHARPVELPSHQPPPHQRRRIGKSRLTWNHCPSRAVHRQNVSINYILALHYWLSE